MFLTVVSIPLEGAIVKPSVLFNARLFKEINVAEVPRILCAIEPRKLTVPTVLVKLPADTVKSP